MAARHLLSCSPATFAACRDSHPWTLRLGILLLCLTPTGLMLPIRPALQHGLRDLDSCALAKEVSEPPFSFVPHTKAAMQRDWITWPNTIQHDSAVDLYGDAPAHTCWTEHSRHLTFPGDCEVLPQLTGNTANLLGLYNRHTYFFTAVDDCIRLQMTVDLLMHVGKVF